MTNKVNHTTAEYMQMAAELVDQVGPEMEPLLDYWIARYEREQQPSAADRVRAILEKRDN